MPRLFASHAQRVTVSLTPARTRPFVSGDALSESSECKASVFLVAARHGSYGQSSKRLLPTANLGPWSLDGCSRCLPDATSSRSNNGGLGREEAKVQRLVGMTIVCGDQGLRGVGGGGALKLRACEAIPSELVSISPSTEAGPFGTCRVRISLTIRAWFGRVSYRLRSHAKGGVATSRTQPMSTHLHHLLSPLP